MAPTCNLFRGCLGNARTTSRSRPVSDRETDEVGGALRAWRIRWGPSGHRPDGGPVLRPRGRYREQWLDHAATSRSTAIYQRGLGLRPRAPPGRRCRSVTCGQRRERHTPKKCLVRHRKVGMCTPIPRSWRLNAVRCASTPGPREGSREGQITERAHRGPLPKLGQGPSAVPRHGPLSDLASSSTRRLRQRLRPHRLPHGQELPEPCRPSS